ncbi:MAG: STAS domain-containing protein [Acidobacteriaceae bacterium]
MTIRKRAVAVKQLPEIGNARQGQAFLREMQNCMDVDRPFVVLDCSNVGNLDKSVVRLMLCCLEEAMKRNGDVKLAALPLAAEIVLEACGVDRLFDIHDTTAGAVSSFHKPHAAASSHASMSEDPRQQPESAA